MYRVLACLLAIATLSGCADKMVAPPSEPRHLAMTPPTLDPARARDAINAYRASKGLRPLVLDARLAQAAKAHAEDLAAKDRISHKGSDASDPWLRVRRTGYVPRLAAENVGAGQASLAEVIKGWKKSSGHNANLLLPDATQMGIALVYNPDVSYQSFWTLVLASPR